VFSVVSPLPPVAPLDFSSLELPRSHQQLLRHTLATLPRRARLPTLRPSLEPLLRPLLRAAGWPGEPTAPGLSLPSSVSLRRHPPLTLSGARSRPWIWQSSSGWVGSTSVFLLLTNLQILLILWFVINSGIWTIWPHCSFLSFTANIIQVLFSNSFSHSRRSSLRLGSFVAQFPSIPDEDSCMYVDLFHEPYDYKS
jgi:hypothetical protein